jgi:RNA recognition motif-containing protein
MGKKLYVGNLSYDTTESDLEKLFASHGDVRAARVVADRDTGRSKGFGFVEMSSDMEAQLALEALNGQEIDGKSLTVHEAKREETDAQALSIEPVQLLINPGAATPHEIGELLAEFSKLYRMLGGSGITFALKHVRTPAEVLA